MKHLLPLLICALLFGAEYEDFSFNALSFEKKPFDYQAYIRSDNTLIQSESTDKTTVSSKNEFNLQADLDESFINLHADYSYFYNKTQSIPTERISTLNELNQHFGDERNSISLGKKVLRWGKGYAYTPLAFFERPKNPIYPELSREGYLMAHMQFTRTPSSFVENYTMSLVAIPDVDGNQELLEQTPSKVAAKLYLLIAQSDIDLIVGKEIFGVDISTNATSTLELHADYGYKTSESSYLAGLRYQSQNDLTLIAEYTKTFAKEKFFYLKATQKEPFELLYSSLYMIAIKDLNDGYRLQTGATYDFKNGVTADAALMKNSESYGGKCILYYYF